MSSRSTSGRAAPPDGLTARCSPAHPDCSGTDLRQRLLLTGIERDLAMLLCAEGELNAPFGAARFASQCLELEAVLSMHEARLDPDRTVQLHRELHRIAHRTCIVCRQGLVECGCRETVHLVQDLRTRFGVENGGAEDEDVVVSALRRLRNAEQGARCVPDFNLEPDVVHVPHAPRKSVSRRVVLEQNVEEQSLACAKA